MAKSCSARRRLCLALLAWAELIVALDVNIVYMATTSTLTKPSADNASEIVNCEMSEIFDLSYKKDIKVEAPDYSDIEDPIL